MDATLRRLVSLLEEGEAETRCAAAVVLGALGSREGSVVRALRSRLEDENPLLRRFAAGALGRLGAQPAIPELVGLVARGGDEGRAAAEALASMGGKGVAALRRAMGKVAPGVRQIIASALGRVGGGAAEDAALASLLDSDPAVVEAARRSLEGEARGVAGRKKRDLAKRWLAFAGRKEVKGSPALAATLSLFEALSEPSAAPALWRYAGRSWSLPVRAAAMRALGALGAPKERSKAGALLDALASDDFALAEPALRLLRRAPLPKGAETKLLPLLEAREGAVRTFAFRALRSLDTPAVGKAVVAHLDHPDPEVREEAEATAVALASGRKALLDRLDRTDDREEAARIAGVWLRAPGPFDGETAAAIEGRALRWIESGDPRWEAALSVFRRVRGAEAFEVLLARGRALRKKKKWKEALAFYRLVAGDRRFQPEDRYDLALVGLLLSDLDPAKERRERDPCLGHFATLVRDGGVDLMRTLRRERALDARRLYYLGFHFAERFESERAFGGEVLQLVVDRWPRTAEGRAAKNKRRAHGLA